MNRIAQLIITLSVSFCAMSCIEEVGTELPDTSDYITVTSEVDMQTKAGYEGTSVLPSSFYMTIKQGSEEGSYTMNRAGSSSNNYNFSGTAPTWKTSDVSQISVKAITASEGDIDSDGTLDFAVQTDQSSDSAVQSSDLLGAKTGAGITISGNNINVAFNHLMSKLQVSYTSELEIDHIELVNVAVAGKYNYTTMMHEYPASSAGTTVTLGNITKMFQNSNSAEAIFFPFDPKENKVTPELRIHIKGTETTLTRKIILKDGSRFLPGKLYMVNISISSNSEVKIENWGANTNVQIPGERVLWIGTSIPSGHPGLYTSYPELVDEALNCTIINNAKGGSIVVRQISADQIRNNTTKAAWDAEDSVLPIQAGSLSSTHAEAEALNSALQAVYNAAGPVKPVEPTKPEEPGAKPVAPKESDYKYPWGSWKDKAAYDAAVKVYNADLQKWEAKSAAYNEWVTAHAEWETAHAEWETAHAEWESAYPEWGNSQINKIKQYSYESLIIPYIDGTKDNCTTVIIDHGYNDRAVMIYEALGLAGIQPYPTEYVSGYNYLMKLKNQEIQYSTPAEGDWEVDYLDLLAELPNLTLVGNYIVEMTKVINAIKATNPNIRIIIGNYFTLNNPVVTAENAIWESTYPDYMYFANLISYYNEAVAGIWDLDIVNVQNYIWLDDQSFYEFCPDGVHPWANPESVQAIADVYIKALDGVIGSRVN